MKVNRVLVIFCSLMLLSSFFGCASKIQKETGRLNLTYQFQSPKEERKDQPIGIVKPDIPANYSSKTQTTQNQLLKAAMQQNATCAQAEIILERYSPELKSKLSSGIQELITRKGFNITGPYESFEDMTYRDKQKAYMTLIPRLNILPENKVITNDSNSLTGITKTTGVIQIGGDYIIDFVEPLTKEKLLSKRINLSDLGIQKEYICEMQSPTSSYGVLGLAAKAAASSQNYTDNYDKALSEAVNEFYAKSMAKMESFIDSEEIVSYKEEIAKLKGLKRF